MIGKLKSMVTAGAREFPILDAALVIVGAATITSAVVSMFKPKASTAQTAAVPKA